MHLSKDTIYTFFKTFFSPCFASVFSMLSFDFILVLFLHVHGHSQISVNLLCLSHLEMMSEINCNR